MRQGCRSCFTIANLERLLAHVRFPTSSLPRPAGNALGDATDEPTRLPGEQRPHPPREGRPAARERPVRRGPTDSFFAAAGGHRNARRRQLLSHCPACPRPAALPTRAARVATYRARRASTPKPRPGSFRCAAPRPLTQCAAPEARPPWAFPQQKISISCGRDRQRHGAPASPGICARSSLRSSRRRRRSFARPRPRRARHRTRCHATRSAA